MKKRTHRTEEEDPHDQQNLELDPLGGTPLRCRSCLGWGTSQVQPGVDCHGNDKFYGNDENVDDVEVTLPSQVKEEQVESLLVLVVVVTTALVIVVINMMI